MDKIEKKGLAFISKRIADIIIYALLGIFIGLVVGYVAGGLIGLLFCTFVVGDCENAGIILLPSFLIGVVVSMIQFGIMSALGKFNWGKALLISFSITGSLIFIFLSIMYVSSV